jgi:hypothetical protein
MRKKVAFMQSVPNEPNKKASEELQIHEKRNPVAMSSLRTRTYVKTSTDVTRFQKQQFL